MAVQKRSMPSFASLISVLSIVFYCAGFLRVELELHEHKKRINAFESIVDGKPPSKDPDIIKNAPGINSIKVRRHIGHVESTENVTEARDTKEEILEIKKLLLEMRVHHGHPNGLTCSSGPPGPPGPPGPRGDKGARGREGQKGRNKNKGDKGIMGPPGKSGKQGIVGPRGLKGETGTKGDQGDTGPAGMRGAKGDIGAPGMTGTTGDIGPPGMKGNKGETGTPGIQGTKGDKGPMGMRGSKGDKGATGMRGSQGDRGPIGTPGSKADKGAKGIPGRKGDKGATGQPGPNKGEPDEWILRDCSDLLKSGHTQSGLYSVNPDGKGYFTVYCDMRTDGGGWTVFQRRQDGTVDFYRGWNDYKAGFGQLNAEFWLGNDKIHRLTVSRPSTLRVELEDWNGVKAYAKYGKLNIGDEQVQYRLEVGSYSGTAGDSLAKHNNMAFTTKDIDNDRWSINCAVLFTGAWWYNSCHDSSLNGQYLGNKYDPRGTRWYHFRKLLSLKFTEMKLRPSS